MADEEAPATDAPTEDDAPKGDEPETDDVEEIASQAENPDAVSRAIKAERQAAKEARDRADELAAKVKEFEDRDKSEQERLAEAATTAEREASEAKAELLRLRVATSKNLPPELADRLRGDDEQELAADADRLLKLVGTQAPGPGDGGAREPAEAEVAPGLSRLSRAYSNTRT